MVTRNNHGRIIICKICEKVFSASGPGSYTYCSRTCRTKGNTASHRRYAQRNREHLNQYARERYLSKWGKSDKETALKAEKFAFSKLLPNLGFTEIYDVPEIRRFVPFDFIATYQRRRVLIDVTTGVSKAIAHNSQQSFADALRMPLYVLFIKPDFAKYQLVPSDASKSLQAHVKELIPIE